MESVEIIMTIWFLRMLSYQHKLCASLFLCTYFLSGTCILFISASDLLLWFDFLSCNCAVLVRAPSSCAWGCHAHKFRWGFFFLLPLESKVNSQVWPGLEFDNKPVLWNAYRFVKSEAPYNSDVRRCTVCQTSTVPGETEGWAEHKW